MLLIWYATLWTKREKKNILQDHTHSTSVGDLALEVRSADIGLLHQIPKAIGITGQLLFERDVLYRVIARLSSNNRHYHGLQDYGIREQVSEVGKHGRRFRRFSAPAWDCAIGADDGLAAVHRQINHCNRVVQFQWCCQSDQADVVLRCLTVKSHISWSCRSF